MDAYSAYLATHIPDKPDIFSDIDPIAPITS